MNPQHFYTKKQLIFLIAAIMVLSIVFETFQQQYYLTKFNLATNVHFFELLKNQSYRWVIWALLATPIVTYTWKRKGNSGMGKTAFQYTILILLLVILNILLISGIAWYLSGNPFSITSFFVDYLIFFAFQKAPLFTLGYISISLILYLFKENSALAVNIQKLGDLKKENQELYNKLRTDNHDITKILTIKIGNKYRAVPVDGIKYIMADDYCVNIHAVEDKVYVMRISMKALEQSLPNYFFRIHRKFIVNLNAVAAFNAKERQVFLKDGGELPVSKNNMAALRTCYTKTPMSSEK